MNIENEIVSFDTVTGSILVKYYSLEVPDGLFFNIDLPIENGNFPTLEKINELIDLFKPTGQLERMAQLKAVDVPSFLAEKIPVFAPVVVDPTQPTIYGADPLPTV